LRKRGAGYFFCLERSSLVCNGSIKGLVTKRIKFLFPLYLSFMKTFFSAAMLFLVSCSDSKTDKYAHLPEHQQKMIRAKELNNEADYRYINSGYNPAAAIPVVDSAI